MKLVIHHQIGYSNILSLCKLYSIIITVYLTNHNSLTDIPELSQELKSESHDGWMFEQDEFVAISLINLPFIDGSAQLAPEVCPNLPNTLLLSPCTPEHFLTKLLGLMTY